MLNQVILQAATPKTLDIDAVDPDEVIIIKSISGLLPSDLTLFTGDYARDGGYYQGRRVGKRNPVFNLKLNPDWANNVSMTAIRQELYRLFYQPTPGVDGLMVVLKDDDLPDLYFVAYPETWTGDLFSQDTSAQISMICVDPYLLSVDPVSDSDATGWLSLPLEYEGSAETGLSLTIAVKATTSKVTVDLNGLKMTLNGSFVNGDTITINTSAGSRSIKKNGVDIMVALEGGSTWLTLDRPSNLIKVYGSAVSDGKAALTAYIYRGAWWGI